MHLGCYFRRVPNRAFHAWCQSMPGVGMYVYVVDEIPGWEPGGFASHSSCLT